MLAYRKCKAARHRTAKSGPFFHCREKSVSNISTKTRPLLNGLRVCVTLTNAQKVEIFEGRWSTRVSESRGMGTADKLTYIHLGIQFIIYTRAFYQKIHHSEIYTKLHSRPEWHIFHILTTTSEDIDDVISHFFKVVCANTQ